MTDLAVPAPVTSVDDEEILACLKEVVTKNPWLRTKEIKKRLTYEGVTERELEDHLRKMAERGIICLNHDGDIPQFRANP